MADYHYALRNALQGSIDPKTLHGNIGPIGEHATQAKIREFANAKSAFASLPSENLSPNVNAVVTRLGNQSERAINAVAHADNAAITANNALKAERDALAATIKKLQDAKPENLTKLIDDEKGKVADQIKKLEQDAQKKSARAGRISKLADKRLTREHEFLSGDKRIEVPHGTGKTTVEMDRVTADAYKKAHQSFDAIVDKGKLDAAPKYAAGEKAAEAAKDAEKLGIFSKAKANGFFKTAGENMNVFAKDAEGSHRFGMKGARIAGVGAGLYIASKGVGQLFSGNEEDSKLMAVGKIVVGGGAAALSAAAGR